MVLLLCFLYLSPLTSSKTPVSFLPFYYSLSLDLALTTSRLQLYWQKLMFWHALVTHYNIIISGCYTRRSQNDVLHPGEITGTVSRCMLQQKWADSK